jgi:hypothetical protein
MCARGHKNPFCSLRTAEQLLNPLYGNNFHSDPSLFLQDSVNEQIISGNQDFPEGGFDGFMQAIVCTNVRHLECIIDSISHYFKNHHSVRELHYHLSVMYTISTVPVMLVNVL